MSCYWVCCYYFWDFRRHAITAVAWLISITGIVIKNGITKTTYIKGEAIDLSGGVITVLYEDGSVVSGLYASGEVTAQSGGYAESVVFGKVAGQNAAASLAE